MIDAPLRLATLVFVSLIVSACSGAGDSVSMEQENTRIPAPLRVNLELVPDKTFRFEWDASASATFYRIFENPDRVSGFSNVSGDLDANTRHYEHRVALLGRMNASYIIQACNAQGCTDSQEVTVPDSLAQAVGYFKANDAEQHDSFGSQVSISSDGNTMAVTASKGLGTRDRRSHVYVFGRVGGAWRQQAVLGENELIDPLGHGSSLSLSANGNLLAVGSPLDDLTNADAEGSPIGNVGAVYLYRREAGIWREQVRLASGNNSADQLFGNSVSLSANGTTLAVGASRTRGDTAVFVFDLVDSSWVQSSSLKTAIPRATSNVSFTMSVSLSADGNTLAVGSEDHTVMADSPISRAGAAYIFSRNSTVWEQQAFLVANDPLLGASFGGDIGLNATGDVLVVGAHRWNPGERVEGASTGAAYVFRYAMGSWQQEARLITNIERESSASIVDINGDGSTIVVDSSSFITIYQNDGVNWLQHTRFDLGSIQTENDTGIEISSTGSQLTGGEDLATSLSLSSDGETLAIGASGEDSSALEINGDRNNNSRRDSGAVFLF